MNPQTVEVNVELLREIFKIAKMEVPKEITDENLLEAVYKLKNGDLTEAPELHGDFNPSSNNILVIDDIGVVTYQLKILLRNLGYNVQVAKDIFSGLNTRLFAQTMLLLLWIYLFRRNKKATLFFMKLKK